MRYNNATKASARGWAWNRICEKIRGSFNRKRARIYVLIGETNAELETAEKKGFSRNNVIGVDLKKEHVERWRAAGGLAIQAPLEPVICLSKVQPSAIIADFCGGISTDNWNVVLCAMGHTAIPGMIICNMLRGRDAIRDFRPTGMEDVTQRSQILLMEFFRKFFWYLEEQGETFTPEERDKIREDLTYQLKPQFYSYKSQDSHQWFDTLAINPLRKNPDRNAYVECYGDDGQLRIKTVEEVLSERFDIGLVKRRLAALEAVRTKKLDQLPRHKRAKYA